MTLEKRIAVLSFAIYVFWVAFALVGGIFINRNVSSFVERASYGILWSITLLTLVRMPRLVKFLRLRYGAIVRIRYIVSNMKGSWTSIENENALREIGIIVYLWFFKKD